jgi:hypothetical protein
MDTSPVISKEAAALRLGCSMRTVDRYIGRGLLATRADPGSRRVGVLVASVEALAAQRIPA